MRVRLVMDASPHHRVFPPSGQASADQESELALESKDEQTQALDPIFVAGKECHTSSACVAGAIGENAVRKAVLDHDYVRASNSLKLGLIVLLPRHGASWHSSGAHTEHFLAHHALVVALSVGLRVVVRL